MDAKMQILKSEVNEQKKNRTGEKISQPVASGLGLFFVSLPYYKNAQRKSKGYPQSMLTQ